MMTGVHAIGVPPTEHLQPLQSTPKVATSEPPKPVVIEGSPPPTDVHDAVGTQQAKQQPVQKALTDLPVASLQDAQSFFSTFGSQGATSIARSGDCLVIATADKDQSTGVHAVKVPLVVLDGVIAGGSIDHHSPLVQSLKVFEAAYNAGLPASAANTIVRGFQAKLDQGVAPKDAMLAAFTNIAVASQVEAYVDNKDGLASDMRRTADFTKEAFDGNTAGGTLQALKNRTLRAEVIKQAQGHLDSKLHAFTDAFAQARETGDYDKAFDTLQKFFTASSQIAETDYWRQRPATVASALQSARPPGPRDGSPMLTISSAIDAAQAVPQPKSLTYAAPQPAPPQSIGGRISDAASAVWRWMTRLTRPQLKLSRDAGFVAVAVAPA